MHNMAFGQNLAPLTLSRQIKTFEFQWFPLPVCWEKVLKGNINFFPSECNEFVFFFQRCTSINTLKEEIFAAI